MKPVKKSWLSARRRAAILAAASSLCVCAASGFTITVTNASDSGYGSLRWAIHAVNTLEIFDKITFNIPGPGVHTIHLLTPLEPIITFPSLLIDGYSQPGSHPNTSSTGDNALLLIEINGSGAGDCLKITSKHKTIRGLVINRCSGAAILLYSQDNVVEGNFLGTDPSGMVSLPNATGVSLYGSNNSVGGSTLASRNLISGNSLAGIEVLSSDNTFQGNLIGLDATGAAPLPNELSGVDVQPTSGNTVGGNSPAPGVPPGNVIAYNGGSGVEMAEGANGLIQGNLILFNGINGVRLPGSGSRAMVANEVADSGELGIDRGEDGVSPNVPGAATNYPVLDAAVSGAGVTTIQGTLESVPDRSDITIEFFSQPACDPSGFGEGAVLIGSVIVATDGSGFAAFTRVVATEIELGYAITATTQVPGFDGSEYSECRWVTDTFPPQVTGITPTSSSSGGGEALVISGASFPEGAAVSIGGVAASAVWVSPTEIDAVAPALPAGTLNDVTVTNPASAPREARRPAGPTLASAWLADFLDVPQGDPFHDDVERIFRQGVTAGCGAGTFCRDGAVRRDQMAVFLLKAEHGASYLPPPCTGSFSDVSCPGPFSDWVERLAAEGITAGCGVGIYCPANPVARAQMAAFLMRVEHGAGYVPPSCTGLFEDVACPGPFADWIEQLAAEGITGGCGMDPPLYCPNSPNTRGQMAVFLTKTFGLGLY